MPIVIRPRRKGRRRGQYREAGIGHYHTVCEKRDPRCLPKASLEEHDIYEVCREAREGREADGIREEDKKAPREERPRQVVDITPCGTDREERGREEGQRMRKGLQQREGPSLLAQSPHQFQ